MIRQMLASDAAAVAEIFGAAREAAHWRVQDVAKLESAGALAWVEDQNGCIVGAVAMRDVASEAEILNLAVAAEWRRKGTGRRLMETALHAARERGATRVFLEVRESNAGARAFYACLGFSQDGRRPNYYRDPWEDALLLSRPC